MDFFTAPENILEFQGKYVAVDTETTGLLWYRDECTDVSFYRPELWGVIETNQYPIEVVREYLLRLSKPTVIIMHNAKFDLHFLGIDAGKWDVQIYDTAEMIHLVDSRYRKSLETAEGVFLGTTTKRDYVRRAGRRKIWEWAEEYRREYALNDVRITYEIARRLVVPLKELGLWNLFLSQMRYQQIIWKSERYGLLIDDDFIDRAKLRQKDHLADLEQKLFDSTGMTFNWNSPKQLSYAIYDNLGIAKPKNPFAGSDGIDRSRFADAGLYKSTCTATFLLTEKTHHPLGTLVAAIRESDRMYKTLMKYQELADDNRIVHGSFNTVGTRTGRLSCSKPNLQNVPSMVRGRFTQSVYTGSTIRTDEYNLRNSFVARPGKLLLSVDYRQMEMRMFGLLSKDRFMLDALSAGRDIHAEIAKKVWGEVTKTYREWSKTIGFGLIYGMTIGSLIHKLSMTKAEAALIRDQYLREFPRIMPWMDEVVEECKRLGYVRYWSNRIWREEFIRDMYKGANAKIQGGCADFLKTAAFAVDDWLAGMGDDFHIVNYVHDELMSEVPEDDLKVSAENICQLMQLDGVLDLPFPTEAKAGTTYGNQVNLAGEKSYLLESTKEQIIEEEEDENYDLELALDYEVED